MSIPKADLGETLLHSREIWRGESFVVKEDRVRLSDGAETSRQYLQRPEAAMAMAYRDGQVMMVYQYRHAVRRHVLEFPAGRIEPAESAEAAARRELSEETGLVAGSMELIFTLLPSVATSSEVLHFYLAQSLAETAQSLGPNEILIPAWLSLGEAEAMIARGEIQDPKSILGIFYLTRRLPGA